MKQDMAQKNHRKKYLSLKQKKRIRVLPTMTFSQKFKLLKNPSTWRRISIANWKAPNDPTVYGTLPINATPVLQFLEKTNKSSQSKVTITHVVAKALALTLAKYPDLNGIISWQKIYLRTSVDIFLQVAIEEETHEEHPDLSGAKIENCDQKSLEQIATELKSQSRSIREKEDPQFKKTTGLLRFIPAFALAFILKVMGFIMYDLGFSFPKLGMPTDPFGSAMVTSVGMFNMPPAFAPLVPISRVPLILCVGQIKDRPWVEKGQLVVKPIVDIHVTFDHRFIDGLMGSRMAHYFQEILGNPESHLS